MKITKSYLKQVIKEELEKMDEAFYQGGGETGEPAPEDLQASTSSKYGAPQGDRSAKAVSAQKTDTRALHTPNLRNILKRGKTIQQIADAISAGDSNAQFELIQKLRTASQNLGNKYRHEDDKKDDRSSYLQDILPFVDAQKGTIAGSEKAYQMVMSGGIQNLDFLKNAIVKQSQNKYGKANMQIDRRSILKPKLDDPKEKERRAAIRSGIAKGLPQTE